MFKEELKLVPHAPGSYQMVNSDGIIIYVGKAKDLNKRLHSYFRGTVTGKTALMVSEVDHFEYIVTKTETEYIFEVSEEFVLDTCGLISSGIVELFDGLKYVMKGMYAFYSMKVMPFKNKWTEIIAKNGGKSDDTPTKCK